MLDLAIDRQAHVATLTLNRPQARNAINAELATSIERAIDAVENDPDIWVSVITGAPPFFCGGADLREIQAGNEHALTTERGGFAGIVWRERTKPMIAAVEGGAVAGGMEIVLSCDLVVASRAAFFGVPEVKRALVAAAGGMFRLGAVLPRNVATELLVTGDPIGAERAYDLGLVNTLTDEGGALSCAYDLAARVTANAPGAVMRSRSIARATANQDESVGWRMSREAMDAALETEDFQEGVAAFLEKRTPVWTGR